MENETKKEEINPEKKESIVKELVKLALIAMFVVIPFRMFIAQPFIVDGGSMDPTFKTGNYLIVDQLSKNFKPIQRGQVIVFKYPKDTTKDFIKRIIGLPGETIEIKDGKVTIKNTAHPDGFVLNEPYVKYPKDDNLTYVLKDDEYFVMGDNRLGSFDSRIWGPVPKNLLIGRPILELFPLNNISIYPGDETLSYNE